MEAIIITITAPNEDEAADIAGALVEARLAACVNITGGVRSIYTWEDKIADETEVMLIVKTRRELFNAVKAKVIEMHSYSIPEIIAIPIIDGSEDYMNWLEEVTS
jgi:periplasmic divalent cation tolerance protein